jgi:Transposase DDE domain group 1
MIQKTVLDFKVESTNEKLTAHSGLALFAECFYQLKIPELIKNNMPKPMTSQGYDAHHYIMPLSLMMYGGGEAIDHVREIREDNALRDIINLDVVPSSSAIGDWLKKAGNREGIKGMQRINDELIKKALKKIGQRSLTLVSDPTIIKAEKRDAKLTYEGYKGYRPAIAVIKEAAIILHHEFKEGNDTSNKLEFIQEAVKKVGPNKRITKLLLDAEYYSSAIIHYAEDQKMTWYIAADKDAAVKELINSIPEESWAPFKDKHNINTGKEVASTVHTMNKGNISFRLIVLRSNQEKKGYRYHCIATNDNRNTAEAVVLEYNKRSEIEVVIKDCKYDFSLRKMPSGCLKANAVYFGIGVLTYNLFIMQRLLTMPESLANKTLKTIRWMLIDIPGKVIKHAGKVILKIKADKEKENLYHQIRLKTYELKFI